MNARRLLPKNAARFASLFDCRLSRIAVASFDPPDAVYGYAHEISKNLTSQLGDCVSTNLSIEELFSTDLSGYKVLLIVDASDRLLSTGQVSIRDLAHTTRKTNYKYAASSSHSIKPTVSHSTQQIDMSQLSGLLMQSAVPKRVIMLRTSLTKHENHTEIQRISKLAAKIIGSISAAE